MILLFSKSKFSIKSDTVDWSADWVLLSLSCNRRDDFFIQSLQNKFTSLSLAFKTDKLTLTNRLELQQRQRDIAEKNIDVEIAQLKKEVEVGGPFLYMSVI